MSYKNGWLAFSAQGVAEYIDRRDNPDTYSGPITDAHFAVLDAMADAEVVQKMFEKPTINGKVMTLFSIYMESTAGMAAVIADMQAGWGNHILVLGAWVADGDRNGLMLGTNHELDQDGIPTGGVTGTPAYPIHAEAWKFMPPVNVYDENGDLVSSTPATSNAGLRDINTIQGQELRRFT